MKKLLLALIVGFSCTVPCINASDITGSVRRFAEPKVQKFNEGAQRTIEGARGYAQRAGAWWNRPSAVKQWRASYGEPMSTEALAAQGPIYPRERVVSQEGRAPMPGSMDYRKAQLAAEREAREYARAQGAQAVQPTGSQRFTEGVKGRIAGLRDWFKEQPGKPRQLTTYEQGVKYGEVSREAKAAKRQAVAKERRLAKNAAATVRDAVRAQRVPSTESMQSTVQPTGSQSFTEGVKGRMTGLRDWFKGQLRKPRQLQGVKYSEAPTSIIDANAKKAEERRLAKKAADALRALEKADEAISHVEQQVARVETLATLDVPAVELSKAVEMLDTMKIEAEALAAVAEAATIRAATDMQLAELRAQERAGLRSPRTPSELYSGEEIELQKLLPPQPAVEGNLGEQLKAEQRAKLEAQYAEKYGISAEELKTILAARPSLREERINAYQKAYDMLPWYTHLYNYASGKTPEAIKNLPKRVDEYRLNAENYAAKFLDEQRFAADAYAEKVRLKTGNYPANYIQRRKRTGRMYDQE